MLHPTRLLLTVITSLMLVTPATARQPGHPGHGQLHQHHHQQPRQLPVSAREAERQTLARLQHELTTLETLIRDAERHSEGYDARVGFDYLALRRDLALIRFAIGEHVNAPTAQPRQVQPLKGDYRR